MDEKPERHITSSLAEIGGAVAIFVPSFWVGAPAPDGPLRLTMQIFCVIAIGTFGRAIWGLVPALRRHHRERKGGGPLKLL